jgi:GNAT superfamily N-acetyltransferase
MQYAPTQHSALPMRIRPFNHSKLDYHNALTIENRVWPEYPITVQELHQQDAATEIPHFYQRYMVELKGQVVGTGVIEEGVELEYPRKFHVYLNVLPEFRGRGAALAFYKHALHVVQAQQGSIMQVNTREDQTAALTFLAHRGFQVVMRYPVYQLDLATFEPARFADVLTAVRQQGIDIYSVAEMKQRDPDWELRIWELGELEVMQDIPAVHPYAPKSFHSFKASFLQSPNFLPSAAFVAADGAHYIGLSTLWIPVAQKNRLYTGLTGVVRGYRRRGIATALNLHALIFAKQFGAKVVETDVSSPQVDAINAALGFTAQPAWLDLQKKL